MRVFDLTPLTRGASAQRRVVIQGFDLPARGLMIVALASIPGLMAVAVAWTLIGRLGLFALPAVDIAALYLIETRTRSGLHLRTYQTLYDRRKSRSRIGRFYVAGQVVDPARGVQRLIVSSSRPAAQPPDPEAVEVVDALFSGAGAPTRRRRTNRQGSGGTRADW